MGKYNPQKLSWGIFTFFLLLYSLTLAPGVTARDSGEYQAAIKTAGIPHPSGAPFYIIVCKIFSFLPLKNFSWRINFFSALCGAFSLFFLFRILSHFYPFSIFPLLSTLIYGCSLSYWLNSTRTEVYTFKIMLLLSSFYLLLVREKRNFAFLILGLAFSVHTSSIILLPLYLYPFRKESIKDSLKSFPYFFLGLLPWIYLPLASIHKPPIFWGRPHTLKGFWEYFTASRYRQELSHIPPYIFFLNLKNIFLHLREEFFPFLLIFLPIGFVRWLKKLPPLHLFFLLLFILDLTFFSLLPSSITHMYLLTYLVISVWIGFGLELMFRKKEFLPIFLLLFVCVSYPLRIANRSKDRLAYTYGKTILELLPHQAVMVHGLHDTIFIFWYLEWVENLRRDVISVNYNSFYQPGLREQITRIAPHLKLPPLEEIFRGEKAPLTLIWRSLEKFIYLNRDKEIYLELFPSGANIPVHYKGILFAVKEDSSTLPSPNAFLHQIGVFTYPYIDGEERLILSQILYENANYWVFKNKFSIAKQLLLDTLKLYPFHHSAYLMLGSIMEKEKFYFTAIEYYRKAWLAQPTLILPLEKLCQLNIKLRRTQEAKFFAKKFLLISRKDWKPYLYLGLAYSLGGELKHAEKIFTMGRNIFPSSLPLLYNLAVVKIKLGKVKEAKKLIEEGEKLAPKEERFKSLEKMIPEFQK